jgi:N-methylhydantoinase B
MKRMIGGSETRLRSRVASLPDGVYRASDFLEHDGHENVLYKVDLELTKRGDTLKFDFSGSSAQAPGFINCTRSGLIGGVAGGLFPTLAYDIPWNQGLLTPCEVLAPDGLVCTAQFPAPVGSATVEAIWVVSNVVSAALNKMLAASNALHHRSQAVNSGTMATFNLGGRNQFGEVFGLHLMDPLAGGSGAFASRDGITAGGPINAPMPSIADVERNEQVAPLFYLHRRIAPDTGGAGKRRGGCSAEVALTLGGISEADSLIMTHGAEVPNSAGLGGGWPGSTISQRFGRFAVDGGIAQPSGEWSELGPKPGHLRMTNHDVFAVTWQGGGGWGDPLERELAAVEDDLRVGQISKAAATKVYGAVLDAAGRIDAGASQRNRDALREDRVDAARKPAMRVEGREIGRLSETLRVVRDGAGLHVATPAGQLLCSGSTRWRQGAAHKTFDAVPAEYRIRLHEGLSMTEWYCPASGTLLAVDVHERGRMPDDDVVLDITSLA